MDWGDTRAWLSAHVGRAVVGWAVDGGLGVGVVVTAGNSDDDGSPVVGALTGGLSEDEIPGTPAAPTKPPWTTFSTDTSSPASR